VFIESKPSSGSFQLILGVIVSALINLRQGSSKRSKIWVLEFDSSFSALTKAISGASYVQVIINAQNKTRNDLELLDLQKLYPFENEKTSFLQNFIEEFDEERHLIFVVDAWKFPTFFIDWLTTKAKYKNAVLGVSSLSKDDCNGVLKDNWKQLNSPL
jgi:hypothetical protein